MLTLHPEEQAWLDEYREALKEEHPGAVLRILIYGSKARGDAQEDSDLDVLLVVKDEAAGLKRTLRRLGYRLAAASYAAPSIMAYAEADWDRLRTLGSAYRNSVERDAVSVL